MTKDKEFTPKSLTAPEYVLALFEARDNVAVLVRNRTTGQTVQRIAKADAIANPEFQFWLKSRNAVGSDIFVGMNPIKEGSYSRSKECIREIRHVYLDLDRNGDQALNAIRNSLEVPAPNFVLNTSPGKHQVVWKVRGFDVEQGESLLRGMATQFGGDPAATDTTRVLRLPGFANRKLSEEFIVEVRHETDAVYALRDFAIEEDSHETPRHPAADAHSGHTPPAGHRSQSERDWAYAKRALARGDDPQEVIRKIADFRADDKSDPEYYAAHTVSKAAAALRQQDPSNQKTDAPKTGTIDLAQDRR
jgi:hypothetical protein